MKFRHILPLFLTVLGGLAISGCLHASAKSVGDAPPLETPPPPPRAIDVVEASPPSTPLVPLVEEPPRQPIRPPARPQPRAEAPQPRPQEPPRVETAEPPPVAEGTPSRPPATLQTTPAGTEGEVERAIRSVIARANADLRRVDYRNLNADARSQYDTAKRFIEQSEEALRPPRNLVFGRNLADKAAGLAAQLAGR